MLIRALKNGENGKYLIMQILLLSLQKKFVKGLRTFGKNFHKIRVELLPGKDTVSFVLLFYNLELLRLGLRIVSPLITESCLAIDNDYVLSNFLF